MICKNCGFTNMEDVKFCENCGSDLNAQASVDMTNTVNYGNAGMPNPNGVQNVSEPGKGLAIAGMVCGIVSFFCFGFITGLLGVIFGAVAKSKGCKSGMATAGIVCGVLGVVFWLISLLACGGLELIGLMM